ncbi:MAG: TfoX/Sxy family protein [Rhodothermia bacterium]|nr:TfoX/Sxy family protein [Rhodothermia bacterium]
MAYSEDLAQRVRQVLDRPGVVEKKMFGGLAFMVDGNMCCGILGDELMLRVGPERFEEVVSTPHARPMDFTGRPSRGMVYVASTGLGTDEMLLTWIELSLDFVATLPPK